MVINQLNLAYKSYKISFLSLQVCTTFCYKSKENPFRNRTLWVNPLCKSSQIYRSQQHIFESNWIRTERTKQFINKHTIYSFIHFNRCLSLKCNPIVKIWHWFDSIRSFTNFFLYVVAGLAYKRYSSSAFIALFMICYKRHTIVLNYVQFIAIIRVESSTSFAVGKIIDLTRR